MTIELLSRYLDRRLSAPDRATVEAHLAECAECRSELIEVGRVIRESRPRHRVGPWALALAAATSAVIVAWQVSTTPPAADRFRATPTGSEMSGALPEDGAVVAREELVFRWTSMGPESRYQVTIQTPDGATAWRATTSDTSVALPDSVVNSLSGSYFWTVDAIRLDGTAASSEPRRFVIRP